MSANVFTFPNRQPETTFKLTSEYHDQQVSILKKQAHALLMFMGIYLTYDDFNGEIPFEDIEEHITTVDLLYDGFIENELMDQFMPALIAVSKILRSARELECAVAFS